MFVVVVVETHVSTQGGLTVAAGTSSELTYREALAADTCPLKGKSVELLTHLPRFTASWVEMSGGAWRQMLLNANSPPPPTHAHIFQFPTLSSNLSFIILLYYYY